MLLLLAFVLVLEVFQSVKGVPFLSKVWEALNGSERTGSVCVEILFVDGEGGGIALDVATSVGAINVFVLLFLISTYISTHVPKCRCGSPCPPACQ